MLFLNVVYNSLAYVNSINRAIVHDYDPMLNTIFWIKAHEQVRKIAEKHPDCILTIRYENFLTDQEVVPHRICQFFGIEFLDSIMDVGNSQEIKDISVLSTL